MYCSRSVIVFSLSSFSLRCGSLHAIEVAFERIDVRGPEPPELIQPGIDLLERLRPQPVEAALCIHRGFHEPGLAQHAQVLGHGRLRHPQLTLDLADRLLRGDQQAQDRAAVRLGDDFENGFHALYIPHTEYACQGIYEDGMIAHVTSTNHPGDRYDLIRVQGARENNLKDVSVEIPKRRLTVFTGVSGSGKSSLVFGTIAAESQRLINETYSAFVQGFMPALARPEVDVLEGLTTAIIVDQERMGANSRSTVGTATDANAMLRVLFSRLGKPHIGSSNAFSFNIPSVRGGGAITVEKGRGKTEKRTLHRHRRHVPAMRGHGIGQRHRPVAALRRQQVAQRGCAHDSRLHGRWLAGAHLRGRGPRPGQTDPQVHEEGAPGLPLQRADGR